MLVFLSIKYILERSKYPSAELYVASSYLSFKLYSVRHFELVRYKFFRLIANFQVTYIHAMINQLLKNFKGGHYIEFIIIPLFIES